MGLKVLGKRSLPKVVLHLGLWLSLTEVAACGLIGNQSSQLSSEDYYKIDSQGVHSTFEKVTKSESYARILSSIKTRTLSAQMGILESQTDDTPFAIDGWYFDLARSRVTQSKQELKLLDARYKSIGAYWQAIGFNPHNITLDLFRQGLAVLSEAKQIGGTASMDAKSIITRLRAAEAARLVALSLAEMADVKEDDGKTSKGLGLAVVITACSDGSSGCQTGKKMTCASTKSNVYGRESGIFKHGDRDLLNRPRMWATNEYAFKACAANIAAAWGHKGSVKDAVKVLDKMGTKDIYTIDDAKAVAYGCGKRDIATETLIANDNSDSCYEQLKGLDQPDWDRKGLNPDGKSNKEAGRYSGQSKGNLGWVSGE